MGALALLMPLLQKVLDFIPDPAQRAQQMTEIITALQAWDAQQNQVNQAEAQNPSIFVAGWRPFIGWVCGAAFAYKFVLQPLLVFGLLACGSGFNPARLPVLDWSEMSTVLLGLLGLGGMRSLEKINGVANTH